MTIDAKSSRSRRQFLTALAGGAAVAGTGGYLLQRDGEARILPAVLREVGVGVEEAPTTPNTKPIIAGCPGKQRNLIVVEFRGGNDGLATLVPYGNGRLRDLRPSVGFEPEELVIINDEFGLNPSLAGLHEQGLAILQGVGVADPNGSHFEMERRWWSGNPSGIDDPSAGFLGRVCDELNTGAPITGMTVGNSASPIMYADKAGTVALTNPEMAWFLYNEDPWFKNLRAGLSDMSAGDGAARRGLGSALEFSEVLQDFQREDEDDPDRPEYPGNSLTDSFRFAADVLGAQSGVRVIHIPFDGFDTHEDQRGTHDYLMMEFNDVMVAFRQDLDRLGLADDTLIATVSEFGRRPEQNGNGTDHGAASVAMLCGPVDNGLHGEHPSLATLDDEDNLVATVDMTDYYATLANWIGVDPSTVLPSGSTTTPIASLTPTCA